MRRYERLNGEEDFDLKVIDLLVRIGTATLILAAYQGDRWGVSVSEDIAANTQNFELTGLHEHYHEEVVTETFLDRGVVLHLGESMKLGRRHGVQIILPNGKVDSERKDLYEWGAFEHGLMNDPLVSKNQVEILSTGLCQVRLTDIRPRLTVMRSRGVTGYERKRKPVAFDQADTDPNIGY